MTMLHQIKTWLRALSFVPTGDELGWIFTAPGGCAISVSILLASPENSLISYGPKLKVWNKGVVNFARPENWVVLDCVVRLLSKGYAPECIELERSWASGHGTSGRLDVLLTQGTGTSRKCFAMIECKCWGAEYNYERSEMLKDGGQLFSYAIQEASTKYLVLYASTMGPGASIKYLAEQVHYGALSGTNQEELHTSWDKSFQLGGLLGDSATPYLSPHKNLKKKDLIELDHDSGSSLFNSFAEILRRHAISDKSNAFNKIFNLFVCKICDEDYKGANDELDFQWKGVDSSKELVETRLPALYKKGLKEYLQIEVNESYFSPLAEFAFIDTYDVKSYEGNAAIIREVVELLQPYQLKYTQKHQFLGDFFEDLLNSGIKQEAGQFFTPTIIARFFLKSIPIHSLVQNRIDEGESDVLPSIIDFSCGAGHFLTEAIDEVQEKIDCIDTNTLVGHHQKRFISIKDNFYWAKEYVYGIEKDYRLAKTTKIAMFLYGDGDAIIVNGDGLDDFKASKTFQGLLKSTDEYSQLEKFDVVVSNPPFSISGFKADVASVDQNFELAAHVGLSSSEIECLFIERAAQLLRPGGYMGLILPLSILNNQHAVYREARKLLLIQFEVCGLVELRDKTFKPTNTTTVGVFGRKRSQQELLTATLRICEAVLARDSKDAAAAEAVQFAISLGVSLDALEEQAAVMLPQITDSEPVWIEGCGIPDELCLALHSLLNNRSVALVFTGDKKEQEAFLGYRYSKARGRETLDILRTEDGSLLSSLYDEKFLLNTEKANSHILAAFNGVPEAVPPQLAGSVTYAMLRDLVKHDGLLIDNPSQF